MARISRVVTSGEWESRVIYFFVPRSTEVA
jgi:hypothetical protein